MTEATHLVNQTTHVLIRILANLDEFGTPREKLPNCPRCGDDELGVIHSDLVMCYRCSWKLEGKVKR